MPSLSQMARCGRAPEQQMGVFVEDDDMSIEAAPLRQGKHDEIFIIAVLKQAGEVFGLAVVERQERFHRLVVGKGHHHIGGEATACDPASSE